jgi:hypothetical protein
MRYSVAMGRSNESRFVRLHVNSAAVLIIVALILLSAASISCQSGGNATPEEKDALLSAVQSYWNTGRDYNLGFVSAAWDLVSADVQGDQADVVVEIIIGYTEPTDGAGYKDVKFLLRNENGEWKVTYDGWVNKEVG